MFHGGCIVCEVRDHRGGGGGPWGGSRYVLLRPTTQSIICDSVRLGREGLGRVNSEDRNSIESQVSDNDNEGDNNDENDDNDDNIIIL